MIKNRVKEFREKLGISQVELARKAHMAAPNLSSIERGLLAPWPKIRKKLAKLLHTTTSELFQEDHES